MSDDLVKVCGVMSLPRLGWNDTWGCVQNALTPFGIGIRRAGGVFWGQAMQKVLQTLVDDGIDWALAIDYDSIFTRQDVNALLNRFGDNPEIDALAPMQIRRGAPEILVKIVGAGEVEIGTEAIPVDTAHFGLTLIRVEALAKMAKPWFLGEPDENGDWGDGRTDADIYFWRKFKAAGLRLCMDPLVRIGHLELMITQFGADGQAEHVYVNDWHEAQRKKNQIEEVRNEGEEEKEGVA